MSKPLYLCSRIDPHTDKLPSTGGTHSTTGHYLSVANFELMVTIGISSTDSKLSYAAWNNLQSSGIIDTCSSRCQWDRSLFVMTVKRITLNCLIDQFSFGNERMFS